MICADLSSNLGKVSTMENISPGMTSPSARPATAEIGTVGHLEKVLVAILEVKGIPVPERNEKGWLPRD